MSSEWEKRDCGDGRSLLFQRTLSSAARAQTALKLLNHEIERNAGISPVALALSTYLAQRWALEHHLAAGFPDGMTGVGAFRAEMLHGSPSEDCRCRREDLEQAIELTKKAVEYLKYVPRAGLRLHRVIAGIHICPEDFEDRAPSFYEIRKYYIPAIWRLSDQYGPQFRSLFSCMDCIPLSEEEIPHRKSELLLSHYCSLLWKYGGDGKLAMLLKGQPGIIDLRDSGGYRGNSESDGRQIQYMLLFRNAIEQVGYFPKDGALYREVLLAELEVSLNRISRSRAFNRTHLSKTTYFRRRKEALEIWGIVLKGYSTRRIISYLSRNGE